MLFSRPMRLWITVAAAVVCLMGTTHARAAKELKWKFKQGEKLPYALQQSYAILIDANGIEIDVKLKQVMDLTWTVKSVDSDGNAELNQKVDRIQLTMNTPFTGEVKYDSKKPDETPPPELWDRIGKPLESMLEGEFALKVTPHGQVTDLVLPEKLATTLKEARGGGGGGGAMMMMGGNLFTENTIRQVIEQAVLVLPKEGVGEGVTWNREFENKLGPLGTQKIAVTYNYAGDETKDGKALEKIVSKTHVTFEQNENSEIDAEMEISEQEGSGEILFDADAGKTVFSKNKQEMTMEGDFMGNEFAQEITLQLLLTQGTSADLPADEPEEKADDDKKDDDKKDDKDSHLKKDNEEKDGK